MFRFRIQQVAWLLAVILPWGSNASEEVVVIKLNQNNYFEVTSKKSVLIKFYAPWCGHCKAMKEDWERLAQDWKDSETGLVAEVDCTANDSEILCEEFFVEGYPTVLYGDPRAPNTYDGERNYQSLSELAQKHLTHVPCNVQTVDDGACPDDIQAMLKDLMSRSREDLEELERTADAKLEEAEFEYDERIKVINEEYQKALESYNDKVDAIKAEANYKWIQMVLAESDESLEEYMAKVIKEEADFDDDDDDDDDGDRKEIHVNDEL